jgi:hypothetical protein
MPALHLGYAKHAIVHAKAASSAGEARLSTFRTFKSGLKAD